MDDRFVPRAPSRIVRWGDSRRIEVPGASPSGPGTATEQDFVAVMLTVPQEMVIYLAATAPPPTTGLSVAWRVWLGCGAATHEEVIPAAVDDVAAQSPIIIRRPASAIRVAVDATNTVVRAARQIVVAAMCAPVAPTWG